MIKAKIKNLVKRNGRRTSVNKWKKAGAERISTSNFLVGYINQNKAAKYKLREIYFNATSGQCEVLYYTSLNSSKPAKEYKTKISQQVMKKIRNAFSI